MFILLDFIINRLHPFCFIFPQIQTRTYLTSCLHALHLGAALADGGELSEAAGLIMMAGDVDADRVVMAMVMMVMKMLMILML